MHASKHQNNKGKTNAIPPKRTEPLQNPKKNANSQKTNYAVWYPVVIIVLTFILYGQTRTFEYVQMDDTSLIVDNEVFIKNIKNLPQAFVQSVFYNPEHLTDSKSYYRPILTASLMLDAQVKGTRSASVFHFFNILYHILACLLLFYLLKKLTKNAELSLVLATIFAIHPVNLHAVAWIPGRNDLLLAIFILLAFHGMVDYFKSKKQKALVLHLVAYAFALFTKESAILFLPLFFLFTWLWEKDILYFWKNKMIPAGYILISALWFLARRAVMHGQEEIPTNGSLADILIHNLGYFFLYIGKILFPLNLNVEPGVNEMAIGLGIASIIGLLVLFYFIKDKAKAIFGFIWLPLFIAPTLLVPELSAYEHRDYIPLIGIIIALSQISFLSGFRFADRNKTIALMAITAVFFVISLIRIPVFTNRFTFWTDATTDTPFAAVGCVNVGHLYQEMYEHTNDKKTLEEAGNWYMKGLKEDPKVLRGNNNYGAYLYLKGQKEEAVPYFKKEMEYHPTSSDPIKNMGFYYKEKGESAKSIPYWEKLISLNHYNLDAYQELAQYYQTIGDTTKAVSYARERQKLYDESFQKYKKLK